jgi:hypothetical protein
MFGGRNKKPGKVRSRCRTTVACLAANSGGRPGDHRVKPANPWVAMPTTQISLAVRNCVRAGSTHLNWIDWRFHAFLSRPPPHPWRLSFPPFTFCIAQSSSSSAASRAIRRLLRRIVDCSCSWAVEHLPRFQFSGAAF